DTRFLPVRSPSELRSEEGSRSGEWSNYLAKGEIPVIQNSNFSELEPHLSCAEFLQWDTGEIIPYGLEPKQSCILSAVILSGGVRHLRPFFFYGLEDWKVKNKIQGMKEWLD